MAKVFRYFKIGNALVRAEYNEIGIKCTYKFDAATNKLEMNNAFIMYLIKDDDEIDPLRREEFEALTAAAVAEYHKENS